jgi:hypothetical protein
MPKDLFKLKTKHLLWHLITHQFADAPANTFTKMSTNTPDDKPAKENNC